MGTSEVQENSMPLRVFEINSQLLNIYVYSKTVSYYLCHRKDSK